MARPAQLDRYRILTAALAVADEHGLDALTMARVAERLSVTPMALYRHVENKAALLDGLVELLLTESSRSEPPCSEPCPSERSWSGLSWSDRLAALAASVRATARRHPSVFPLLLQRPAATAAARRTRDAVCAALREAGLSEQGARQMERLVSTAVLGFAVSEVAGRFHQHSPEQIDADFRALEQLLADALRLAADREL